MPGHSGPLTLTPCVTDLFLGFCLLPNGVGQDPNAGSRGRQGTVGRHQRDRPVQADGPGSGQRIGHDCRKGSSRLWGLLQLVRIARQVSKKKKKAFLSNILLPPFGNK